MFYHMQFCMDATSKVLRRFNSTKSLINFKRFSILSKSLLLIQQLYKYVCNKISLCLVHMPAIPYLLQTEFLDGQGALNVVVYYFVSVTNIQYDIHFQVMSKRPMSFISNSGHLSKELPHSMERYTIGTDNNGFCLGRRLTLLSWEQTEP